MRHSIEIMFVELPHLSEYLLEDYILPLTIAVNYIVTYLCPFRKSLSIPCVSLVTDPELLLSS